MGPRAKAGLALTCAFVFGLVAGIAIERHYGGARLSPPHGPSGRGAAYHEATMQDLRETVGLDDAQVQEIETILARHHEEVQLVWQQLRPEVQKAMQDVHVEIADTLRPDQRRRFHEWLIERGEQEQAPEEQNQEVEREHE